MAKISIAPKMPKRNETASAAKGRGLDYFKVLAAASNGDKKALAQFFSRGIHGWRRSRGLFPGRVGSFSPRRGQDFFEFCARVASG